MRLHVLATTLASVTFLPALQAQQVIDSADSDRKASTVFVSTDSFETLVAVCIGYCSPTWLDSYDNMLAELKGSQYTRLGKGWWTTLDTIGTIEIGGTKIEAGSYYLGLAVGQDGAFSLLLFDSKQTMKAGLLPSTTALYTGEAKAAIHAPLAFAKHSLPEVAGKMEIAIAADKKQPTTGRFSIRWGKHELSAPVKFHFAEAKTRTAPNK